MSNAEYIFALHLSLRDIEPPIWRRLLVPYDVTLMRLHDILQVVMGWQDQHLFEFHFGSNRIGVRDPAFQDRRKPVRSARKSLLKDFIGPQAKHFLYIYDMGDYWEHDIVVEEVLGNDMGEPVLQCVAGARRCPPEDIGGAPGFEEFKEALADPSHDEYDYYVEVYGDTFDPEQFDLNQINHALEAIKRKIARAQKRRTNPSG